MLFALDHGTISSINLTLVIFMKFKIEGAIMAQVNFETHNNNNRGVKDMRYALRYINAERRICV